MNRKLITTIAVILLASLAFYFLMVYSNNITKLNELNGGKSDIVKKAEPPFRNDGILFLLSASNDTISKLEIEIVKSEEERNQGLMYRKSLDENRGMLFIFPESSELSFWMKNTILSLDIIYLDSTQTVVTIHKNTLPYSEEQIPSFKSAQYVLEVNAGFCEKKNVKEGDKIKWEELSK